MGERVQATGVVLAGGLSTRFGSDKASALLGGRALVEWVVDALADACPEMVIVRAKGQVLPELETSAALTIVDDVFNAKGPLAGIVAGFEAVRSDLCFVTACDVPLLQPALVAHLLSLADAFDVVCARTDGSLQPLVAVYRPTACLPAFRRRVGAGQLKVIDAFEEVRTRYVDGNELRALDPDLRSFLNANGPDGLVEIEALLENAGSRGGSALS